MWLAGDPKNEPQGNQQDDPQGGPQGDLQGPLQVAHVVRLAIFFAYIFYLGWNKVVYPKSAS
jgi:hypothetical protein